MTADEVLAVHNGSAAEGVPVWIDGGQEVRCIAAGPIDSPFLSLRRDVRRRRAGGLEAAIGVRGEPAASD
ncbi:hypothetical protein ABGB13_19805 [Nonomuraea sp. B10E8]